MPRRSRMNSRWRARVAALGLLAAAAPASACDTCRQAAMVRIADGPFLLNLLILALPILLVGLIAAAIHWGEAVDDVLH